MQSCTQDVAQNRPFLWYVDATPYIYKYAREAQTIAREMWGARCVSGVVDVGNEATKQQTITINKTTWVKFPHNIN